MRTGPCRRRPAGFTIVEIIIVAGILGLIFTLFLRFLQSRSTMGSSLTTRLTLQIEARKAADLITAKLREASEVVRPTLGETLPYLVFFDAVNRTGMLYPVRDDENSALYKKEVFKLMAFVHEYAGSPEPPKVLARSIKRMAFTLLAPNSVQVSITVANEKEEYQFLTSTGLMNFGSQQ